MAQERLAPDTIVSQVEISGPLSSIQDDPDSPDGNWWTASTNGMTSARVGFPTPSGSPVGAQEHRILVRKNASGGNSIIFVIELFETGSAVVLASSGEILNAASAIFPLTWDVASLSIPDGSAVELGIRQTDGASGNPGNRRYLEIGAVEWNAEVEDNIPSGGSTASVNVDSQGAGSKLGQSGAQAVVNVDPQGVGQKLAQAGATAQINIDAEGGGEVVGPSFEGGSTATIQADAQADGLKLGQAGASATVQVSSDGSGTKTTQGQSTATIQVDAEGGGQVVGAIPSGGATAQVNADAESGGAKLGQGSGSALVNAQASAAGAKTALNGANSTISIDAQGAGQVVGAIPSGGAMATIQIDSQGSGKAVPVRPGFVSLHIDQTAYILVSIEPMGKVDVTLSK